MINSASNVKFQMCERRFFKVRPQKYTFRQSWVVSYNLACICIRLGNQKKKKCLKSSWVSETNYQEHGWVVTGNALLWEMVSTPLMSSDQGWTSFRKVLHQMRTTTELLSSACDYFYIWIWNGWQGTWKSDDKMCKQVSGVPFFISQCNRMILGPRMNWVLPEVWLGQYSSPLALSAALTQ